MEQVKLSEIFEIKYWNQFDLNKMEIVDNNWVFFVTRSSKNLWVSSIVKEIDWIEPFPSWCITVSLWWTYLLSSFVQQNPFYTWQNIKVLIPKEKMNLQEKIYYCMIIEFNRYRYTTHWREANQTLDNLLVPKEPHLGIKNININFIQSNSAINCKFQWYWPPNSNLKWPPNSNLKWPPDSNSKWPPNSGVNW